MKKEQAIKWIEEIQCGKFDRNEIVFKIPRGSIAIDKWNDPLFSYGMEYGVIYALIKVFDIDMLRINHET